MRRNLVINTGSADPGLGLTFMGIRNEGTADISDNTVSGLFALPGSYDGVVGISSTGGSVSGNRVRGVVGSGTGLLTP